MSAGTRDERAAGIAEVLAEVIRSVTDLWDAPLDEVHDVPQIVNALLASPALARYVAEERAEAATLARRAVNDPGAFVKRGADYDGNAYGERLDQWRTRAITAALTEDARGEVR